MLKVSIMFVAPKVRYYVRCHFLIFLISIDFDFEITVVC